MARDAISREDRDILRELAKRQREHAESDKNRDLIRQWYQHNACRGERPMVTLELWTFEQEVIPHRLRCRGEAARAMETNLYRGFLNRELFGDDTPVRDHYPVHWHSTMLHFGLAVERVHATTPEGSELGHQFVHPIEDLEDDFHKFGESVMTLDREGTGEELEQAGDLFGDILPPRLVGRSLECVPTQKVVHYMGMENMFLSMYDYPGLFHEMMRRYTDDSIAYYRFLERERALPSTAGSEDLNQGSYCFTEELPGPEEAAARPLVTRDLWGFMDSQETVAISPDMFGEFIFPYYHKVAVEFGLLSYGCCEPVHPIWESYLSTLPNLRKLSISPWCDEKYMGEALQGRGIIYHRKPSPNFLGGGGKLDEQAFREHVRATALAARGLPLEITQRDVYTINRDEAMARRFVEIVREEVENHWRH